VLQPLGPKPEISERPKLIVPVHAVIAAEIAIGVLVNLAQGVTIVAELNVPHESAPSFGVFVRIRPLRFRSVIPSRIDVGCHEV
jgi:hypothetical protein